LTVPCCGQQNPDGEQEAMVEPKSRSGRRRVPSAAALRDLLVEHKMRSPNELVFGRATREPFDPEPVTSRAQREWRRFGLEPITLHEARYTFASLTIAAGVNARALTTFMGHASIAATYDRYGHLMPGNENEAAALLDAYLERANSQARLAAPDD
jgi:integrase